MNVENPSNKLGKAELDKCPQPAWHVEVKTRSSYKKKKRSACILKCQ